jgi:predicted enzyme related to lactoylglutathione lyase
LGVDDVQKEFERLKSLGVTFKEEPTNNEWGIEAVFDDTCGNYIKIHQDPKAN